MRITNYNNKEIKIIFLSKNTEKTLKNAEIIKFVNN